MNSQTSLSQFVWHDCLTPDIDRAIDFFSVLTNWKVIDQISPNVGRYPIVHGQNGAIAGILEMPKFLQNSGVPPYWTGYVHTDLKLAKNAIPKLAGQIFTMPAKSAMGMSFVFTDSGGAVLSAYEPSESFAVPSSCHESEIVWQRLYSADPERSIAFYEALFDWQAIEGAQGTRIFQAPSDDSVGVPLCASFADMGAKPTWIDSDTWVYFLGASDVSKTTSAIEGAGGSIVEQTLIEGRSAIVAKDSQGGVIGFVEPPFVHPFNG